MFPSYVENPDNFRFEGQDPDEKILLLLRAHPITNVPWIFSATFVLLLPFIVFKTAPMVGFPLSLVPQNFLIIFLIINYLFALLIVFEGFLSWYFNVTVITNEKIVDMSFAHLLYKGVDLAPLQKIEEADSVVTGAMGTMFNFGDVKVQTAGATIAIEMKNIPRPANVADMILDLISQSHEHGGPK